MNPVKCGNFNQTSVELHCTLAVIFNWQNLLVMNLKNLKTRSRNIAKFYAQFE